MPFLDFDPILEERKKQELYLTGEEYKNKLREIDCMTPRPESKHVNGKEAA